MKLIRTLKVKALTLVWLKAKKTTLQSTPKVWQVSLVTQKLIMMYWILQVTKTSHIYNTKTKFWDSVTNRIFCSKLDQCSSIVILKEIPWDLTTPRHHQLTLTVYLDEINRHRILWAYQQMHLQWNISISCAAESSMVTSGPQKASAETGGLKSNLIPEVAVPAPSYLCTPVSVWKQLHCFQLPQGAMQDKTLQSEVSFLFFISTRSWPKAISSWLLTSTGCRVV